MINRKKVRSDSVETRVYKSEGLGLGEQLELIRENREKQATAESFLNHGTIKKPGKGKVGKPKATDIEVAVDAAKRRSREGDWVGANGKVLVGLFAMCHEIVYGDIPLELRDKRELILGAKMANKALHEFFDDDPDSLVEFVKWSWEVEKRKESWALRNGIDRPRMRVRFQFSLRLIQDYRTEINRSRKRVR